MTVHNHFYLASEILDAKIIIKDLGDDTISISFETERRKNFFDNWYRKLNEFVTEEQNNNSN